jgi:hypothetical protein
VGVGVTCESASAQTLEKVTATPCKHALLLFLCCVPWYWCLRLDAVIKLF